MSGGSWGSRHLPPAPCWQTCPSKACDGQLSRSGGLVWVKSWDRPQNGNPGQPAMCWTSPHPTWDGIKPPELSVFSPDMQVTLRQLMYENVSRARKQIFLEREGREIKTRRGLASGHLQPSTTSALASLPPLAPLHRPCLFLETVLHENEVLFYLVGDSRCGFDRFLGPDGSFPV